MTNSTTTATTPRRCGFYPFAGANGLSMIGDSFRVMALTFWIYEQVNSPGVAIAMLMFAQFAPSVLMGMMVGALVDRWSRRRVLIACDALRAVIAAALVACVLVDSLWGVLALTALSSGVTVFASVAGVTAIPALVDDLQLERANSTWATMDQLSFVVGPALAAGVYPTWGAVPALVVDGATYLLSLVVLVLFVSKVALSTTTNTNPEPMRLVTLRDDVRSGLRYLRRNTVVRAGVAANALRSLSAGINNTIMIFFVTVSLGSQVTDLAWLSITNGVVQIAVGGLLIALAARAPMHRSLQFGSITIVLGALVIVLAPNLPTLVLGVVISALGNAPANIGQSTLEQRFVESGYLGRVRGFEEALLPLAFLVASFASGYAVDSTDARVLLAVSAAVVFLAYLIVQRWVVRPVTKGHAPARQDRDGPDVALAQRS